MALKRIELVFYIELDDSLILRQKSILIGQAARDAARDGLAKISDPSITQVKEDSWEECYPYLSDDDRTMENILSSESQSS